MIKRIIKILMIIVTIAIIILMVLSKKFLNEPLFPFMLSKHILTYKYANYIINKDNTKIERENREINIETANKWIESYFGPVVSKVIKCEYIGKRRGRSWYPDSEFVIHIPFCEDKTMFVDSETQEVFTSASNISTDPKFQHLYSNWIKKQVGIDDENVELEFSCGGIDFANIESLSKDMTEIFENANMYCKDIRVYNLKDLNYDNSYTYAMKYKEIVFNPVFDILGEPEGGMTTWIHLYSVDEDSGEQYYFKFNSKNRSELIRSKV